MKSRFPLAAASAIVCLSLGALSAHAQTSATTSVEAKPVTVPTPMGPHLNETPSTVITGTIEGITDKGPAAATENLAEDFKAAAKPATATKVSAKRPKGAKVTAKGVAKALTAAKPAPMVPKPTANAPAQANVSVDTKVQTN